MPDNNNNIPPVSVDQTPANIKSITSVDQITKIIKRNDIAYASHFMIPSLKKEVPFNEINTSQQKRLVKSVLDSPVYNTEFIYTLREILKENCLDTSIDIDDLTIIDKLILALGLRMKSVGDKVEIEVQTKNGENVTAALDIPKILQMALSNIVDIEPKTIEDPFFIIECSVPTIRTEYMLEKELRNKTTNIEIEDIEKLRQTVGEAFIGEVVKYISKISVKLPEGNVPVEWSLFNFAERIKVVETFKTGLLKSVLDYINLVRREVDKVELVKFEFRGEEFERRLTIDGNFFMIS
jgi:hypothetical protein